MEQANVAFLFTIALVLLSKGPLEVVIQTNKLC